MTTMNINGKVFSLETPRTMGIINATPDSFYKNSRVASVEAAILLASEMVEEGVDIIDLGATSSRPGAQLKSAEDEWHILQPILRELACSFPETPLSVDTIHGSVAEQAINAGAGIINDISAFQIDSYMFDVVEQAHVPYVLMHMQGRPQDMQVQPHYDDVVGDILQFFIKKVRLLRDKGVKDIILDPGFGFGKRLEDNYEILRKLSVFRMLECPLLVGMSRKSMLYKMLNISAAESLAPTSALHLQALLSGAKILRVHDVKEAVHVVQLHKMLTEDN